MARICHGRLRGRLHAFACGAADCQPAGLWVQKNEQHNPTAPHTPVLLALQTLQSASSQQEWPQQAWLPAHLSPCGHLWRWRPRQVCCVWWRSVGGEAVVCMQSYMDMTSQGLRPSLEDEPGLQSLPGHSKG